MIDKLKEISSENIEAVANPKQEVGKVMSDAKIIPKPSRASSEEFETMNNEDLDNNRLSLSRLNITLTASRNRSRMNVDKV